MGKSLDLYPARAGPGCHCRMCLERSWFLGHFFLPRIEAKGMGERQAAGGDRVKQCARELGAESSASRATEGWALPAREGRGMGMELG